MPLPGEGGSRDGQSSNAGPSAGAASAVLEPHLGLLGPDSAPEDHAAAPPPTGAAESQGRPEAPRPTPAPEPSAPKPSAPAEPGLASTAAESGLTGAAAVPGPAELGPADVAAETGPADAAAETEMQLPPERPAASEPTPSALSAGRERRSAPLWPRKERAALATERAQLAAAWRVFDSRLAAARAANEDEQRAMEEGRKALEEARAEVVREQKALEDTRAEFAREREDTARLAEPIFFSFLHRTLHLRAPVPPARITVVPSVAVGVRPAAAAIAPPPDPAVPPPLDLRRCWTSTGSPAADLASRRPDATESAPPPSPVQPPPSSHRRRPICAAADLSPADGGSPSAVSRRNSLELRCQSPELALRRQSPESTAVGDSPSAANRRTPPPSPAGAVSLLLSLLRCHGCLALLNRAASTSRGKR
ncbi:uncharacterized protein LOC133906013 [Phragmites australis]|uniref:uncharacterized protein LOC133906013 n=1 Tax=Phragmites australis TaxID=29695 RepID=UPI002D798197|nr:uncharacterized protein LOC133906013 [Phragmites australis]